MHIVVAGVKVLAFLSQRKVAAVNLYLGETSERRRVWTHLGDTQYSLLRRQFTVSRDKLLFFSVHCLLYDGPGAEQRSVKDLWI